MNLRFSSKFKKKKNATAIEHITCDAKNSIWDICLFFINIAFLRHLKLNIELVIPASNEYKI